MLTNWGRYTDINDLTTTVIKKSWVAQERGVSNPEARKGKSLERMSGWDARASESLCIDCVACHSSHRLFYDQMYLLRGSLVFMEPRIVFRCARSIQTDRRRPRHSPLWVGSDRQIPTSLGYRPGTRQIWSRAVFSHLTRQTDRSHAGLATQLPCYLDILRHYVGRQGSFMFPLISVLVLSLLIAYVVLVQTCM